MRKVIIFVMVSLDGFFEGPHHELDWHNVDAEFNKFAIRQLRATDIIVFGRATYQLMAGYWPTPAAKKDDPVVAKLMNATQKIVVSKTLKRADWENTLVVSDISELARLKRQPGKDIIIFGSAKLASSLAGVIDEYRIMVSPAALGQGKAFFTKPMRFSLLRTQRFKSGNVLLCYALR